VFAVVEQEVSVASDVDGDLVVAEFALSQFARRSVPLAVDAVVQPV
jgi:hypothetical protein